MRISEWPGICDRGSMLRKSAVTLLITPLLCSASVNVLNIDGIMRVSGMPLEGMRIVVLPQDGEIQVLTRNVFHLNMSLELQTTYLLAFERPGCVTKQLYFDTHVPEEYLERAPFDFPFKVTLEAPPKGRSFEYAGPVGNIHFDERHKDFAYDTDYSLIGSDALVARMREAEERLPLVTMGGERQSGPSRVEPMEVRTGTSRPGMDAFPVLVPTGLSAPALLHPPGSVDRASTIARMAPHGTRIARAPVRMELKKVDAPVWRVSPTVRVTRVVSVVAPSSTMNAAKADPAPSLPGRDEQLIVERNRVTTVVRITQDDHTLEYRRVAQRYGAVFYFKNGLNCDALTYERGTGK